MRSAAEVTDILHVRAIHDAAVMLPLTRCSPFSCERRASAQNTPSSASMATRRPWLSIARSSQASNSRIAAISFERGVPPSPNMRKLYQTYVRLSSPDLRAPLSPPDVPATPLKPPPDSLFPVLFRRYACEPGDSPAASSRRCS